MCWRSVLCLFLRPSLPLCPRFGRNCRPVINSQWRRSQNFYITKLLLQSLCVFRHLTINTFHQWISQQIIEKFLEESCILYCHYLLCWRRQDKTWSCATLRFVKKGFNVLLVAKRVKAMALKGSSTRTCMLRKWKEGGSFCRMVYG